MRRQFPILAALVCSALAASVIPVKAAPACASEADQSTFEVLALREMMTLLATKCGRETDYNNDFIKRFQPILQANDRAVLDYFRRVYGNAGRGKMDTFSFELVNEMSHEANPLGTEFCPRAGFIISEMNALRSMAELAPYAAVKDLPPVGMSMCVATSAAPRRR